MDREPPLPSSVEKLSHNILNTDAGDSNWNQSLSGSDQDMDHQHKGPVQLNQEQALYSKTQIFTV